MAKIKVLYECEEEIDTILKKIERYVDMKSDDHNVKDEIQFLLQNSFDEGRKFQKGINTSSIGRDCKLDI